MAAFYIILLLVGSVTVTKKVNELAKSIKKGDKEKISVDIFFLILTLAIIAALIAIKAFLLS